MLIVGSQMTQADGGSIQLSQLSFLHDYGRKKVGHIMSLLLRRLTRNNTQLPFTVD